MPRIGGGIGNRLFEYAAAAGAAEAWGRRVVFAHDFIEVNTHDSPITIFKMFPEVEVADIPEDDMDSLELSNDDLFVYRPLPEVPPSDRPVLLKGFFQSPLYFPKAGIQPDWRTCVGAVRMAEIQAAAGLAGEAERRRTWFIHFRFGDYKGQPLYKCDLSKYRQKCLMVVPRGARLHVFSDEPDLCRAWLAESLEGRGLELTWSTTKKDVEALYEMSLCWGGAITANSTFSWWGAYFAHAAAGPTHRAYYPDVWGDYLPPTTDLVPSWGEKVATEWTSAILSLKLK